MGTIEFLTEKIEKDGRIAAEKILNETQKQIEIDRDRFEKNKLKLEKETSEFIESQKPEIKKQFDMALAMEKKRLISKTREEIVGNVENQLRQRIYDNISRPDYPEILIGWIAEGAIGLNEETGVVNSSEKERTLISKKLLSDAETLVKKVSGLRVKLVLSEKQPLTEQGITVSTEDGRVSYNNKVSTRLKRLRGTVLEIINDELLKGIG